MQKPKQKYRHSSHCYGTVGKLAVAMALVTLSYAKTVDISDGWKNPKHVSLEVKHRKDEISPSIKIIKPRKEKAEDDKGLPTKASIKEGSQCAPLTCTEEEKRLHEAKAMYDAYSIHQQILEKQDNYVQDAGSYFTDTWNSLSNERAGPSSIKVGTDCSGLEAPIIALRNMGVTFDHIFSCENDASCVKTIRANHSPGILYPDIQKRNISKTPYVDLYIAGFPCQPFSVAGKQQGFEDTKGRGDIFFDVLTYIQAKTPKVFILENVEGLVKGQNGRNLRKILKLLRKIMFNGTQAYHIQHKIMDTKEHGIPHSRKRWYCVGIRKDIEGSESFEFPGSIPFPSIDFLLDEDSNKSEPQNINPTMKVNIQNAKDQINQSGGNAETQPFVLDCDAGKNKMTCTYNYSPCLTKSRNRGHWLLHEKRRMNINEMLRLQGIDPTKFVVDVPVAQLGQQIGNAMSVNVIERILVKALEAAKLIRPSSLKGKDSTLDRWENGQGFEQIRSSRRQISKKKNNPKNKERIHKTIMLLNKGKCAL